MAGNDTMPITIPIGLDAKQMDEGAGKAIAAVTRFRQSLRTVKDGVQETAKSMEELGREQEKLGAKKDKLSARLQELVKQYEAGERATVRDADAQAKLAAQISSVETQIQRVNTEMEKNSTQQYANGIQELDQQINQLEQDTQREVTQLQIAGQATEARARAYQGAAQMAEVQSQRVDLLRNAVQRASQAEEEGSRVTAELSRRYNAAQGELVAVSKGLAAMTADMQDYSEAAADAGQATGGVVEGILGAEVTFKRVGDTLTNSVTKPLVDYGKAALDAAISNESMEQSFDTAYKGMANEMRAWSKQTADELDASEYRLRGFMSSWKGLLEGMEIGAKDQEKIIKGLSERVYDMAAMYDTTVEEMFEKLNSGLVGSSKPLRDHGIVITENMVKQYAYKNSIAETGTELTEQEKVLGRYGLIMQSTAQTTGRWSDEADTLSGRLKTNDERMSALSVRMGETLVPVMERALGIIEPIIKGVSEMDEGQLQLIVTIGGVVAAIGPLLNLVGMLQQMRIAQGITGIASATKGVDVASGLLGRTMSSTLLPSLMPILAVLSAIAAVAATVSWIWSQRPTVDSQLGQSIIAAGAANQAAHAEWVKNQSWLPKFARGTNYAPGGPSLVHDGEIIDLPQGAQVHDARKSKQMLSGGNSDAVVAKLEEMISEVRELVSINRSTERAVRDSERLGRQRLGV